MSTKREITLAWALLPFVVQTAIGTESNNSSWVFAGGDGRLEYKRDARGNSVPDFSNAGYMGGGVRIPVAPVKVSVEPAASGDDTARIQKAIDEVAKMPADSSGIRGAVLLKKGKFRIADRIAISTGGIVLRGEGQDEDGTVLVATGKKERHLIEIRGASGAAEVKGTRQKITTDYVPVGAKSFSVADGSKFKIGDTIIVSRHGNAAWIHEIKMDQIEVRPGNPDQTKQWTPFDLNYDRVITAVHGNQITVDAPVMCAIETKWGGGDVFVYADEGRISQCGVENLRGDSEFDPHVKKKEHDEEYFADENHALGLVAFVNAKNSWARDLTAIHFYNGVSSVESGAKWITVQDCTSLDPVSEITGGRRYPFAMDGQLSLVQRCYSRHERHSFVVGARVAGPNVFLDCKAEHDYATSEPHHRWSTGGLYDNVSANMAIQDRQYLGSGHGWAGANYVVWNCEGSLVCQQPPTAQNWAIGFVGKKSAGAFKGRPDGYWESFGHHVEPRSLYLKQLEDRLGSAAVQNIAR